jgi:hypothetical protein
VPVREHLLAADHVSIPGIKPGPDRAVPLSQPRAGQRDAPRIERRDSHQLTGHAFHPNDHSGHNLVHIAREPLQLSDVADLSTVALCTFLLIFAPLATFLYRRRTTG